MGKLAKKLSPESSPDLIHCRVSAIPTAAMTRIETIKIFFFILTLSRNPAADNIVKNITDRGVDKRSPSLFLVFGKTEIKSDHADDQRGREGVSLNEVEQGEKQIGEKKTVSRS